MAAFTSKATGNWSSAGETTWNEVGVPANGDTVTIGAAHTVTVDVNTTVGTSPVADTDVITCEGNLVVAAGVTFTVRGDTLVSGSKTVTLGAGASWIFDASLAADPGATNYRLKLGTANFQNVAFICNGTSGSHCTVTSDAGGANGCIKRTGALLITGQIRATYTDFSRLGSASLDAIYLDPQTGNDITFTDCTFDNCGNVATHSVATGQVVTYLRCHWSNSLGTASLTWAGGDTGSLTYCSFDKIVHLYTGAFSTITHNYFALGFQHTSGVIGTFQHNLTRRTAISSPLNIYENVTDCYLLHNHTEGNPHFLTPQAAGLTVDGCVFEYTGSFVSDRGDVVFAKENLTVQNCILLPDADDVVAAVLLSAQGGATSSCHLYHNTVAGAVAYYGESYAGHAGIIANVKSNLCWKPAGSATVYKAERVNASTVQDGYTAGTHNWGWGLTAGNAGRGWHNANTGTTLWTVGGAAEAGFDPQDLSGDPLFIDSARDIGSWGQAEEATDGTVAAALAVIAADPSKIPSLVAWVKEGFSPSNGDLADAGHDGVTIGAVEITTRDWLGTTSTDTEVGANWIPAAVPGSANPVEYNADGNNACLFTAPFSCASLTTLAGYTAKIDLGDIANAITVGGNVVLDNAGEFDMGDATLTCGGSFDNLNVTMFTGGSSTLVMTGTGNLTTGATNDLFNLTIDAGAVITVADDCQPQGAVAINGTLSVSTAKTFYSEAATTVGAAGKITGVGLFRINVPGAGEGLTSLHATGVVDVTTLELFKPHAAAVLAAGTYASPLVKISNNAAAAHTWTSTPGTYVFTGDFEMENTNAGGTLIIDNGANNPSITFQGDVIHDKQAGTLTYTKGTSDMTLTGLVDVNINFGGQASEDLVISKATSGDVTLNNCDLALQAVDVADNFTVTSSTITSSADAKTIDGNVNWSHAGNVISCGTGTVWTIGGDFNYSAIGTITQETAKFVLEGSGPNTVTGHVTQNLYSVTFATDSSYIVAENVRVISGILIVKPGAAIEIATTKYILGSAADVQIDSGAVISGAGLFYLFNATLSQQDGEISTECKLGGSSTIVGGNYSGLLRLQSAAAADRAHVLTGAFTAGYLEFDVTGAGNLSVDCTGLTGMMVAGDTTFDLSAAGDLTVDNTGNSCAWVFQGDVIDELTSTGTVTWTAGGATASITASGSENQAWDLTPLLGQTLEAIVVNKSGGTLTFFSGWTAASYTQTAGTVDFNGQTVVTVGDWTVTDGTIGDMEDADLTVGGDFSVFGADLVAASGGWDLNVTGAAVVQAATIKGCTSVGTVYAYGCTDGGGNSENILFLLAGSAGRSRDRHCPTRSRC